MKKEKTIKRKLDRLIKKYWIPVFNNSNSLNESIELLRNQLNELESEWVIEHWDEFSDFVENVHHYGHKLSPPIMENTDEEERIKMNWKFYQTNRESIINEWDRLTERFDDVQLVDGVLWNRKYPDSFEIPSEEEKDRIVKGDYVKVSDGNERFWTVVEETIDDGFWVSIDNILISNQPYNLDDYLRIHRNHIIDFKTK
jgi:hypothetical protein